MKTCKWNTEVRGSPEDPVMREETPSWNQRKSKTLQDVHISFFLTAREAFQSETLETPIGASRAGTCQEMSEVKTK